MKQLTFASITLLALAPWPGALAQTFSANIGFNSEYVFRGIPQSTSSAFGGADFSSGGFYAGAWAADVGQGLEIDYYGGYALEAGDFGLSVGGTWYTYTDDFDDEYLELNLGVSWKWLSLDAALGEYDNFGAGKLDYAFYSVTLSHGGFHGRYAVFGNDFDGSYYEAGYRGSLTTGDEPLLDYAATLIYSDSTLLGGESDTQLVFTLSKTFSL